MSSATVIPKRIQLETIFGCNASCTMCMVDEPTSRSKGRMSQDLFMATIDEFADYKDQLEKVDLFGIGEPLLDKLIFERIAYAKSKGLPSVAISTNADLLDHDAAKDLLDSGIDTVIFSIDGTDAKTHEAIRMNTNFDRIIENVERVVGLRNARNSKTRFVFRFIVQDSNRHQWEGFRELWRSKINAEKGDLVIGYDVQSWGGSVGANTQDLPEVPPELPCHHVSDRMIILRDGTVPLCCADVHDPELDLGNVRGGSAIETYNGPRFREIREMHMRGRRNDLRICRDCTILNSELTQKILTE